MYLVTVVKEDCTGCEVAGLFHTEEKALEAQEKIKAYLIQEECDAFEILIFSPDLDRLSYYDLDEVIAAHPKYVDGTYTSVWDDGIKLTSKCTVNMDTKMVMILESLDVDVRILENEYITLNGEDFDVCPLLERESEDQFWYE